MAMMNSIISISMVFVLCTSSILILSVTKRNLIAKILICDFYNHGLHNQIGLVKLSLLPLKANPSAAMDPLHLITLLSQPIRIIAAVLSRFLLRPIEAVVLALDL
uniref:Uncharacterized protein n=1 Tax=Schistocephalus solidus TaxID=70667 RepID=A0A0X3PAW9_SCHSO